MKNRKIYKFEIPEKKVINPGDSSELPDDFIKIVVFIDNAYLIRIKNYFFKGKFKYDLKEFVLNIAKKNDFLVQTIFIYDAPPFQTENPSKEENIKKENYDKFSFIFKKQGIILREGRTQRLKVGDKFIYKQKGVDMLLGIDAVSVKNDFPDTHGIVLLTGDSDFVPLVKRLKNLKMPVFLWTYFDRVRKSVFSKSNHLIQSVENYYKLTKDDFLESEIKGDNKKKQ